MSYRVIRYWVIFLMLINCGKRKRLSFYKEMLNRDYIEVLNELLGKLQDGPYARDYLS